MWKMLDQYLVYDNYQQLVVIPKMAVIAAVIVGCVGLAIFIKRNWKEK